jgi:hypothetical protein
VIPPLRFPLQKYPGASAQTNANRVVQIVIFCVSPLFRALPVQIVQNLAGKVGQHSPQSNHHIFDFEASTTRNRSQTGDHLFRLHLEENEKVVLRMAGVDAPHFQGVIRKVFQVKGWLGYANWTT